jgi:phosphocarrier protein HPr
LVERSVTVRNQPGIHARPAALFVRKAAEYKSEIYVKHGELTVNGKSIMGVMMLAAETGAVLLITANGPDEEQAADALARLVHSKFGEEE